LKISTAINNLNRDVEYVKRLGIGTPNSLCDGIAEFITWRLQDVYKRDYGEVHPYNVDYVHVHSGETRVEYGHGNVLSPSVIVIHGDIAPSSFDAEDMITDSIVEYLGDVASRYDINCIVPIIHECGLNPLLDVNKFKRNYFDYGSGYASNSPIEFLVRSIETDFFPEYRKPTFECPIGTDVTVSAYRFKNDVELSVECAMICEFLADRYEYEAVIADLQMSLLEVVLDTSSLYDLDYSFNISVNKTGDNMTHLGTLAESKDGYFRQGNGCNGLINPFRPMHHVCGMDAQYDVEKIYSMMSTHISELIVNELDIADAEITIISKYGEPILDPQMVSITTSEESDEIIPLVEEAIKTIDITEFSPY
jgi:S-adenosylmethionine synthetase